jgi:preprotein translocase subunit SecG
MLLNILLVVIILVCFALVFVILLQQSEGGALGMSGSGPGNFMTARGTGDFLTSATQILAGVFFALCLLMTLISSHNHATASVVDQLKLKLNANTLNSTVTPRPQPPAQSAAPAAVAPATVAPPPAAPVSGAPDALNPFGPSATLSPAKPAKAKSTSSPPASH